MERFSFLGVTLKLIAAVTLLLQTLREQVCELCMSFFACILCFLDIEKGMAMHKYVILTSPISFQQQ